MLNIKFLFALLIFPGFLFSANYPIYEEYKAVEARLSNLLSSQSFDIFMPEIYDLLDNQQSSSTLRLIHDAGYNNGHVPGLYMYTRHTFKNKRASLERDDALVSLVIALIRSLQDISCARFCGHKTGDAAYEIIKNKFYAWILAQLPQQNKEEINIKLSLSSLLSFFWQQNKSEELPLLTYILPKVWQWFEAEGRIDSLPSWAWCCGCHSPSFAEGKSIFHTPDDALAGVFNNKYMRNASNKVRLNTYKIVKKKLDSKEISWEIFFNHNLDYLLTNLEKEDWSDELDDGPE